LLRVLALDECGSVPQEIALKQLIGSKKSTTRLLEWSILWGEVFGVGLESATELPILGLWSAKTPSDFKINKIR
jgi:hypothetical protein